MIYPRTTTITLPWLTSKGVQTWTSLGWGEGNEVWYSATRSQPLKQTWPMASPLNSVQPTFIGCQVICWLSQYKNTVPSLLLSWKASVIDLANGLSTHHLCLVLSCDFSGTRSLTGPKDTEYTNTNKRNIPSVDFEDARGAIYIYKGKLN